MICRALFGPQPEVFRIYKEAGIRFFIDLREQWVDDGEWQLFQPHYHRPDSELAGIKHAAGRWVEYIPGFRALTDRAYVWNSLLREQGREKACAMMPETFVLAEAPDRARLATIAAPERFILKTARHRRSGIRLVESAADALALRDKYMVAQRFIDDQTRFRDTTLHLRCYLVLRYRADTLETWFFEDAICGWAKPPSEAASDLERLVTHPDNVMPPDYPCSLEELSGALGFEFEKTWWDIASRVAGTVASCAPVLCRMPNLRDATCFQLFGVDVLLLSDRTPRICEFQVLPEIPSPNPRYAAIKARACRDTLNVAGILTEPEHGYVKVLDIALPH